MGGGDEAGTRTRAPCPTGGAPSVCSLCGSGVLDLTVAGNSQWSGRGSGCRPRRLPSCRAAPSKSSAASGFPVDRGGPTGRAHTRPPPAVWRCGTAVLAQRHGGRRAPRAVSEVSAPGPRTLFAGRCPPERPPGLWQSLPARRLRSPRRRRACRGLLGVGEQPRAGPRRRAGVARLSSPPPTVTTHRLQFKRWGGL